MSEVSTQAGDPANAPIRAGEIDKASDYDSEGYDRRLSPPAMSLIMVASVLYALFHLAVLNFWAIDEWMFRVVHVNMGALIAFVALRGVKGERMDRVPLRDWLLIAAAVGCTVYIQINLDQLLMRTGVITTTGDFICGVLGTLLVMEFARRCR